MSPKTQPKYNLTNGHLPCYSLQPRQPPNQHSWTYRAQKGPRVQSGVTMVLTGLSGTLHSESSPTPNQGSVECPHLAPADFLSFTMTLSQARKRKTSNLLGRNASILLHQDYRHICSLSCITVTEWLSYLRGRANSQASMGAMTTSCDYLGLFMGAGDVWFLVLLPFWF